MKGMIVYATGTMQTLPQVCARSSYVNFEAIPILLLIFQVTSRPWKNEDIQPHKVHCRGREAACSQQC